MVLLMFGAIEIDIGAVAHLRNYVHPSSTGFSACIVPHRSSKAEFSHRSATWAAAAAYTPAVSFVRSSLPDGFFGYRCF